MQMATLFTNDMEFEIQFRDILFQMYAKKEKFLIPREVYNRTTIELSDLNLIFTLLQSMRLLRSGVGC
jgi:hypothetical protein